MHSNYSHVNIWHVKPKETSARNKKFNLQRDTINIQNIRMWIYDRSNYSYACTKLKSKSSKRYDRYTQTIRMWIFGMSNQRNTGTKLKSQSSKRHDRYTQTIRMWLYGSSNYNYAHEIKKSIFKRNCYTIVVVTDCKLSMNTDNEMSLRNIHFICIDQIKTPKY